MAFIELDQREVLNRDQTKKKKKTVSLDTFLVKAISKASPSATHINLQNAITEAYPVFYCCAKAQRKCKQHKFLFPVLVDQISNDLLGVCLESVQKEVDRAGVEYEV